jgi:uncharacterized membrane protein SirB2
MLTYESLKLVHVVCVVVSVTGFVTRYVLRVNALRAGLHPLARVLPHINDTILLAAAVAMLVMTNVNPFESAWLTAKLVGLIAYIALGIVAMRHVGGRRIHVLAFGAAILSFGYVVSVAMTKSPMGYFAHWPD